MLSYRHAFHAGNFADVHKHAAWLAGIRALKQKPAPFRLYDVYAGAGIYALDDAAARKTGEWEQGIGRLADATGLPGLLTDYLAAVAAFRADDITRYPGSPALAAAELRAHDGLVCLELHPADHSALKQCFARDRRVHVHRRDAREGLPALVPPPERRGLVLVDPPYEQAGEYADVPKAVRAAWQRWPTGSYLLWYPLLASEAHRAMLADLAAGDIPRVFVQELWLYPDAPGLRGSGLAWINPPFGVDAALAAGGRWLAENLGAPGAHVAQDWRVPERGRT